MACASSCRAPEGTHESYGQCLRSQSLAVMGLESTGNDLTTQKRWDRELQAYRDAKAEGIQPSGTTHREIDLAKKNADLAGNASGTITVETGA